LLSEADRAPEAGRSCECAGGFKKSASRIGHGCAPRAHINGSAIGPRGPRRTTPTPTGLRTPASGAVT
jgi:hypothetical protein